MDAKQEILVADGKGVPMFPEACVQHLFRWIRWSRPAYP